MSDNAGRQIKWLKPKVYGFKGYKRPYNRIWQTGKTFIRKRDNHPFVIISKRIRLGMNIVNNPYFTLRSKTDSNQIDVSYYKLRKYYV